jgi:hypothetical protein
MSKEHDEKFPTIFLDALIKDDWRDWVEAYRKEWSTWELTNSYAIRKWNDMKDGTILTRLYELTDIKKNGRYKVRPVLAGETMRKDLDYGNTFARTASSDIIRFIVAFNVSVRIRALGRRCELCFPASEERQTCICIQAVLVRLHTYGLG